MDCRFRNAHDFDWIILYLCDEMKKLILGSLGAIGLIAVFSRLGWSLSAMLDWFSVLSADSSKIPTEFFVTVSFLVFMSLAGLFYHFVID